MHPSILVRRELRDRLSARVRPLGVEVLDWYPPSMARAAAVCLTGARADIERVTFAAGRSQSFEETWSQQLEIIVPNSVRDQIEAATLITDIYDQIIAVTVEDHTLGVTDTIRVAVVSLNIRAEENHIGGEVELSCQYRITRSVI